MRKKYLLLLCAGIAFSMLYAHTPYGSWDSYYFNNLGVRDTATIDIADTLYVAIKCRNGKHQAITAQSDGSIVGQDMSTTDYDVGDSLTWKIIKGASLGNIPRVRLVNVKTNQYLKCGTVDGTLKPYTAPLYDDIEDAQVDFFLKHQDGVHYFLLGTENFQFFNANEGIITVQNKATSTQGWALYAKQGPQPKTKLPEPTLSLTSVGSDFYAGGSITLNAQVTKGAQDLQGKALLYIEDELIDELELDGSGFASQVVNNPPYGESTFTLVYTGDDYYGALSASKTLDVLASPSAKKVVINASMPSSTESHKQVTLSFDVKTTDGDVVNDGDVLLYVNGNIKNRCELSFMGTSELTFPNFLPGTVDIQLVYQGDKINFLDSDPTNVSIDVTPSSSSAKPYPVYYDLSSQHEIVMWEREHPDIALGHKYTQSFFRDSLPGVLLTDTVNYTLRVSNQATGTSYGKLSDAYNHADYIMVPLGSGRATSVHFKTPWLNEGSYNVYLVHRKNSSAAINITGMSLDGNEAYWPNEELDGRWVRKSGTAKNTRQFNAKGGDLYTNYFGSVYTSTSGVHTLRIEVADENGDDIRMDMLQFIPVDQDSLVISLPASECLAKTYYPLFSWLGFPYHEDYDAATVATTFSDNANLALPYQVEDQTDWGENFNYSIDSLSTKYREIDGEQLFANYVTVYRAEDRWTRVAEGYVDDHGFFGGQLPQGEYYYETDYYVEIDPGAYNYRTLIDSGTFSLPLSGLESTYFNQSSIKVFGANQTLRIHGINSGAQIIVADITGRMLINTVSSSDNFVVGMPQGVFVVTVLSQGNSVKTKVLIR